MLDKDWVDLLKDDLDKLAQVASPGAERTVKLRSGERRRVAILFLDIKGFTSMSETLDPEEVGIIMDHCFQIFTKVIEKYGGYVDKYIGDCIMALFGCQKASEKDTERAIRAALELHEKLEGINVVLKPKNIELGMRIGISTGLVVTGHIGKSREGDFTGMGDAVNLASRLETNAQVGGILISEESKELAGDVFIYKDLGEIQVKGKAQPISVFQVEKLNPATIEKWERSQQGRHAKFVGRSDELSMLQEAFKRAEDAANKHQIITVTGAAGIGKSRLAHEFLQLSPDKRHILKSHASPYIQNPYEVFTFLLKRYAGLESEKLDPEKKFKSSLSELSGYLPAPKIQEEFREYFAYLQYLLGFKYDKVKVEMLDPKGRNIQIKIALRYFCEALSHLANKLYQKPLVLFFEDMENCEESSSDTLHFILENAETPLPLVVLVLFRPEYTFPKIQKDYTDLTEIKLEPLEAAAGWDLVDSMVPNLQINPEHKDYLLEKAGGNPFFLEELIHSLLNQNIITLEDESWVIKDDPTQISLPDTVTGMILYRLDLLETNCKELLKSASVIGREFLSIILDYVWKNTKQEIISPEIYLEELSAQNIILRINLEGGEGYVFKHLLSKEVAYSIILNYNKRILHGLVAEAIEKFFINQLNNYYAVLALHYHGAENWTKAAHYYLQAGEKAQAGYENKLALQFLENAAEILANKLEPDENLKELYSCYKSMGDINNLIGSYEKALQTYQQAQLTAEKMQEPEKIMKAFNLIAATYNAKGDFEKAESICHQALQLGDDFRVYNTLAKAEYLQGKPSYKEHFEQALAIAKNLVASLGQFQELSSEDQGILKETVRVRFRMGQTLAWHGDTTKGFSLCEAALDLAEKIGDISGQDASFFASGDLKEIQGEKKQAMEFLEEALKLLKQSGDIYNQAVVLENLAWLMKQQGNLIRARELNEEALKIRKQIGDVNGQASSMNNLATLFERQGDMKQALKLYQAALTLAKQCGSLYGQNWSMYYIARYLARQGNFASAMELLEKALTLAKQGISLSASVYVMSNMAISLARQGDLERSLELCQEALELAKKIVDTYDQTETMIRIAKVIKQQGDLQSALDMWEEALKLAKKCSYIEYQGLALAGQAEVLVQQGQVERALEFFDEALKFQNQSSFIYDRAATIFNLAQVIAQQGDQARARKLYLQAAQMQAKAECYVDLSSTLYELGNLDKDDNIQYLAQSLWLAVHIDVPVDTTVLTTEALLKGIGLDHQDASLIAAAAQVIPQSRPEEVRKIQQKHPKFDELMNLAQNMLEECAQTRQIPKEKIQGWIRKEGLHDPSIVKPKLIKMLENLVGENEWLFDRKVVLTIFDFDISSI